MLCSNAFVAFFELLLLLGYLRFIVFACSNQFFQVLIPLRYVTLKLQLSISCRLKISLNLCQLLLGLHSSIDNLSKVLLVLLLYDVDLIPGLVLYLLTLSLVLFNHILKGLLQVFELFVLLLLLILMLLLHFFALLLLPGALLRDHVFELLNLSQLEFIKLLVLLIVLLLFLLEFEVLFMHFVLMGPLEILKIHLAFKFDSLFFLG